MFSALADGFSEFASVVTKDAQSIVQRLQEQSAQFTAQTAAAENDDDPTSSPLRDGSDNDNSGNGGRGADDELTQQQAYAGTAPPGVSAAAFQELLRQREVFTQPLSAEDVRRFTPSWLSWENNMNNSGGDGEQEALQVGLMAVRSNGDLLARFTELFPEASDHSLDEVEQIRRQQQQSAGSSDRATLLPSEFFRRYVVCLNRLVLTERGAAAAEADRRHAEAAAAAADSNRKIVREQQETILGLEGRVAALLDENSALRSELASSEELVRQLRDALQIKGSAAVEAEQRARALEAQVQELNAAVQRLQQHHPHVGGADSNSHVAQQRDAGSGSVASGSKSSSTVKVDEQDADDEWADVA